ncbi:MAG TPA: ribose 5-phosphate isomerase A, partial [Acidimicrobiales bacterium]
MSVDEEKRAAAESAAELVERGMRVGLGTGTTVAFLLEALGRLKPDARFVATSPETEVVARRLGLRIESFDEIDTLDLAIDGADQIAPDGWLVKGRGGAHLREKIVAGAARRFVVIADSTKPVPSLHAPVPLELSSFGLSSTLRHLEPTRVRDAPRSPDGGVLADYLGEFIDPLELARRLSSTPGVVAHGLFAPSLVTDIILATGKT